MATIKDYQDAIIAEKANHTELDDLNSTSATAIWRMWTFVMAVVMWTFENLLAQHKIEVSELGANLKHYTAAWFVRKAKDFQYGDTTQFLQVEAVVTNTDGTTATFVIPDVLYDPILPATDVKRIVKFAAVTESSPSVIKVAKADGSGLPEALSSAELTAFRAYINDIKPPGFQINATSGAADEIALEMNVYYDGEVDSTTINMPAAINAFLANLPFDGQFITNKFRQAMIAVAGVNDVEITTLEGKVNAGTYANIGRVYNPAAGYIKYDSVNSTITLIAD